MTRDQIAIKIRQIAAERDRRMRSTDNTSIRSFKIQIMNVCQEELVLAYYTDEMCTWINSCRCASCRLSILNDVYKMSNEQDATVNVLRESYRCVQMCRGGAFFIDHFIADEEATLQRFALGDHRRYRFDTVDALFLFPCISLFILRVVFYVS